MPFKRADIQIGTSLSFLNHSPLTTKAAMNNFPILIITGRPAAGKSELIDFLKNANPTERIDKYHVAEFEELDDFVYVWKTFEVDDMLTKNGNPRLWTDEKYYFNDHFIWNLYIERISLEYR